MMNNPRIINAKAAKISVGFVKTIKMGSIIIKITIIAITIDDIIISLNLLI